MKYSNLVVLAFFISAQAWASTFATPVKVISSVCGTGEEDEYRGSGVLLYRNNVTYIVSSDHVLYLGKNACYSIGYEVNHKLVIVPASKLAVEWESGLSLLKLNTALDPKTVPQLSMDNLTYERPPKGAKVVVQSFPFEMRTATDDRNGSVLFDRSTRHLFPHDRDSIEIDGAYANFGMSGGPVFEASGSLIGLMSHMVLIDHNGKAVPTILSRNVPDQNSSRTFFAIPTEDVINFLKSYFDNPIDWKPLYALQEGTDSISVVVSNLQFTMKAEQKGKIGGHDIGGLHGGGMHALASDTIPNSGALPQANTDVGALPTVQVGGSGLTEIAGEVTVQLTSNQVLTSGQNTQFESLPWIPHLRHILGSNKSVRIPYLMSENKRGEAQFKVDINNLEQFFRLLLDQYSPMTPLLEADVSPDQVPDEVLNLARKSLDIINTYFDPKKMQSRTLKAFIPILQRVFDRALSADWKSLSTEQLVALMPNKPDHQADWSELTTFANDYQLTPQSNLHQFADALITNLKLLSNKIKEAKGD